MPIKPYIAAQFTICPMKYRNIAPIIIFLLGIVFCDARAQQLSTVKLDSFFNVVSSNSQVMGSIMIAKDGKSIYEKIIGYSRVNGDKKVPATLQTQYRIGSISKTFTAVMMSNGYGTYLPKFSQPLVFKP